MWTQETYYCADELSKDRRFAIIMAGITYCDGAYNRKRECSPFHLMEYVLEGEGTVKLPIITSKRCKISKLKCSREINCRETVKTAKNRMKRFQLE